MSRCYQNSDLRIKKQVIMIYHHVLCPNTITPFGIARFLFSSFLRQAFIFPARMASRMLWLFPRFPFTPYRFPARWRATLDKGLFTTSSFTSSI